MNPEADAEAAKVAASLLEPFALGEVKFKPQKVSGNRAMCIAYIDARHVMDRLDEVVGIANWRDEYQVLPDGTEVECRLWLRIAGEWIAKVDVGGMSEQPDGGDRMKAAYSDALKRAAVKFGVGRFLYRTKQTWQDYDPVKKHFVNTLKLVQQGDAFLVVPATAKDIRDAEEASRPAPPPPPKPPARSQLCNTLEAMIAEAIGSKALEAAGGAIKDNAAKLTEDEVKHLRSCYGYALKGYKEAKAKAKADPENWGDPDAQGD